MALILGLREGDEFEVGPDTFRVSEVVGKFKFKLVRGDGQGVHHHPALARRRSPTTSSSRPRLQPQNGVARVSIDAPRELPIKRPDYQRQEAAE